MSHYKNPCEYPFEAFIQRAVEEYLYEMGFSLIEDKEKGYTDIVARNHSGREWFVEVKGKTSDSGLDFKTAIGQIAGRIDREDADYAIAVPKTPAYIKQAQQLSPYFRKQNNLHFIFVDESGHVEIVNPEIKI